MIGRHKKEMMSMILILFCSIVSPESSTPIVVALAHKALAFFCKVVNIDKIN
jgi:hypothetical protein